MKRSAMVYGQQCAEPAVDEHWPKHGWAADVRRRRGVMRPVEVRRIDEKRFNALAAHSRSPAATYISEELAWFANEDETVLGVLVHDLVDNDYVGIALARDEAGRFRAFDLEVSIATADAAETWIVRVIKWHT